MTSFGIFFFSCALFGLLLGLGITQRWQRNHPKKKMGCLPLYIIAVSVCLSTLTFPFIYFISNSFVPLFTGDRMSVTIVDQTWHYSTLEDSDGHERTVKMFTPVVAIMLDNGSTVQRELDYSSGDEAKIGSSMTIYFNQADDQILSINAVMIIVKILGFTTCLLMLTMLWFGTHYALGVSRGVPLDWMFKIGFYVLIPMMMIGFTLGLLSYLYKTWFLGNTPDNHPVGIALIVVFFVGCMVLAMFVYFKGLVGGNGKEPLKGRIEKKVKGFKYKDHPISSR